VEGGDAPGEFVGDACAAEFAEGVGGVWAAGVDDGVAIGHVVEVGWGVVVVGDDEVYAEFFCAECGGVGGDAAVDGDEEFGALVGEGVNCGFVEAIALVEAVGDVGVDCGFWCDGVEDVVEDCGGGDAVDIVIAEDGDFFVFVDGGEDSLGGFVEVWDEGGVVEGCEGWVEEIVGGFLVVEISGGHDSGDEVY